MDIADVIKEIRTENNLNQIDFAKKIGVGKSIISYWENKTKRPGYENIRTICEVFDLPPDYILGFSDYGTEPVPTYIQPKETLNDREKAVITRLRAIPPDLDYIIIAALRTAEAARDGVIPRDNPFPDVQTEKQENKKKA